VRLIRALASRLGIRRPRLRTVFLAVSLALVVIPLTGVHFLRLYQSVLVRRTEADLITQAAYIASAVSDELIRVEGRDVEPPMEGGERYRPIAPRLDLALHELEDEPTPARATSQAPDPALLEAAQRVARWVSDAKRVTLTGARVVDRNGVVVASTGAEVGLSLRAREEVHRALAGEVVTLMRRRNSDDVVPVDSISRGTRFRVWVAMPIATKWLPPPPEDAPHEPLLLAARRDVRGAVLLGRTPLPVSQSLYGIRYHVAAAALVVLALVVAVATFTSSMVTQPVAELMRRTQRVAAGDWSAAAPLPHPRTREVEQLSESFASMARTLEHRSEYIRAFAASVSHEFKTPLTSIRGTVELLRDRLQDMSGQERARFLDMLDKDAHRLSRLVARLLDLARADVSRPTAESVALPPVVDSMAERFRHAGLHVSVRHEPGVGLVKIAPATLESLLAHVLENAQVHGGPGVEAHLDTRLEPREAGGPPGVAIHAADTGRGISESNLSRVFEPFFTTARVDGGTGLGLSIVRSLVTSHGGTVDVASRPGRTVVRIWLPA
jgi:signal transduction histidine kinase